MRSEATIRAALDGKFFAMNFNTGRVVTFDVRTDYIPDHRQQFFDFVPDKVAKPAAPVKTDEIVAGPRLEDETPLLADILAAVSHVTRIGKLDLLSRRRAVHICEGRQLFFWFARYFTLRSYPEIGLFCGKRDHTTVMHGVHKIDGKMSVYSARIAAIAERLGVNAADARKAA